MSMRGLAVAQFQDMVRNPMLVVFWGINLAVGWMMTLVMPDEAFEFAAGMLLLMTTYFVGWNIPAHAMAEEKEKRVLEALFLTPVRPWHVVAVRAILAVAICLVFGAGMLLILGQMPAHFGLLLLGYLLVTLFTVAGGTLMGLVVKDMRSLGTMGTPVLLLLIFASTLPWEQFHPAIWEAQRFLPTRPAMELLQAGYLGKEVPVLQDGLVMLAYIGLLLLVCTRLIRRLAFARL